MRSRHLRWSCLPSAPRTAPTSRRLVSTNPLPQDGPWRPRAQEMLTQKGWERAAAGGPVRQGTGEQTWGQYRQEKLHSVSKGVRQRSRGVWKWGGAGRLGEGSVGSGTVAGRWVGDPEHLLRSSRAHRDGVRQMGLLHRAHPQPRPGPSPRSRHSKGGTGKHASQLARSVTTESAQRKSLPGRRGRAVTEAARALTGD